jgi:hypothetical protein
MDKQVGLLVMRDENDILDEYLTRITEFYDQIFVLDGSEDDIGGEICSKYDEVVFYEKDKNVISGHANDSIRGFLWDKIKASVTGKEWVGVLHPDEFPDSNPLEMLSQNPNASSVAIVNQHFFLHSSQRDSWNFRPGDSIEKLSKWYMAPGWTEYRYFKFDKDFQYGKGHGSVIPHNSLSHAVHTDFVHKQYTYRSYDQVMKRAKDRWESNWQRNDYCLVLENNDIFFDTLKYPDSFREKYPEQYERCWYNMLHAFVAKVED